MLDICVIKIRWVALVSMLSQEWSFHAAELPSVYVIRQAGEAN